jgi:hypothetical protein
MRRKLAATVAATVAALLLLTGCFPDGNSGGVPPEPPRPVTPNNIGPNGEVSVVFTVETFETIEDQRLPTVRDNVLMIINAFGVDGKMASYVDKVTGETRPGPQSYYKTTPWPYEATLGTGIASVSVSAILEGAKKGDGIRCTVEVGGTLYSELGHQEVVGVPYASAQVTCSYLYVQPGGFRTPSQ